MSDIYEFGISGRIGPLIRSCLPELTPTAEGESTVLTGTAQGPGELQQVLELLDAHGCQPLDIRISYRTGPGDHGESAPGIS